jgi:putative hydrolase of the HAD superfamily
MRVFPDYSGPMSRWPRLEAIPYAQETLAALRPGWIVALATNAVDSSEAEIRDALARVQLDECVDRVRYQQVGCKNLSCFFEFILDDLGLDPSRAHHGDNYEEDTGANRSAQAVVQPRSDSDHPGDVQTIHDPRELEDPRRMGTRTD